MSLSVVSTLHQNGFHLICVWCDSLCTWTLLTIQTCENDITSFFSFFLFLTSSMTRSYIFLNFSSILPHILLNVHAYQFYFYPHFILALFLCDPFLFILISFFFSHVLFYSHFLTGFRWRISHFRAKHVSINTDNSSSPRTLYQLFNISAQGDTRLGKCKDKWNLIVSKQFNSV